MMLIKMCPRYCCLNKKVKYYHMYTYTCVLVICCLNRKVKYYHSRYIYFDNVSALPAKSPPFCTFRYSKVKQNINECEDFMAIATCIDYIN